MSKICVLIAAMCLWMPAGMAQDGEVPAEAEATPSEAPEAAEPVVDEEGPAMETDADMEGEAPADDEPMADDAVDEEISDEELMDEALSAPAEATQSDEDGRAYGVRIRELEGQLDELKEDVFRSKSRLYLLREQIVQDSVGNARASIEHVNEFTQTFELLEVRYSLDGTPIYSADMSSDVDSISRVEMYSGVVLPGVHNLSVQMTVRGRARGPFTYARGYEFVISTSHSFTVEGGQSIDLDSVAFSGGNAHEDFSRRPDVRFDQKVISGAGREQSVEDRMERAGDGGASGATDREVETPDSE